MPRSDLVHDDDRGWVSVHLFLSRAIAFALHDVDGDGVVLDIATPIVERCIDRGLLDRYFFIRYWEDGAHVRLRLRGPLAALRRETERALAAVSRTSQALARTAWIDYVPETQRYGGARGLAIAEDFFRVSSDVTIALLRECRGRSRSARLGRGLLAMLVVAHALRPDRMDMAQFFETYHLRYLQVLRSLEPHAQEQQMRSFDLALAQQEEVIADQIAECLSRLDAAESVTLSIDGLQKAARSAIDGLRATTSERDADLPDPFVGGTREPLSRITSAHIHMTNNRLGLTTVEEAYLSYMCGRSLTIHSLMR